MVDTTPKKKGTNPLVVVGIGCLVLLVIIGVVSSLAIKFFAKRIGVGLLQGAIESKTGVKTNLQDIANGNLSFTDKKTGAKMDIGTGKIPDTFPKDFPLYPGVKVTSVLSGAEQGKSNGFWLTLSTTDSLDKVSAFYQSNLKSNGWATTATYTAGNTTTETVTKGKMSGTVAITAGSDNKETDIVIVLGEDQGTSQTDTTTPQDTPTE